MADTDVVVIGAGFTGLYAVHKFRDQHGLSVRGFEAAGGIGGTWWWNRYPGARCDIESVYYSYSFSEEIQREWRWSERYAGQDEILKYLEWVADRLDLRRSFQLGTRVVSLVWDEDAAHWSVTTDDGRPAQRASSCPGSVASHTRRPPSSRESRTSRVRCTGPAAGPTGRST
jgi:cation diffusion facilitator CzcD-associated flavoprotein CzcO